MKKIPHKILITATVLTFTTVNLVIPTATFASEMDNKQTSPDILFEDKKWEDTLRKSGDFAQIMNQYSYVLLRNPMVTFEGVDMKEKPTLPSTIKQHQENAIEHANTWDSKVKKEFLSVLDGTLEFSDTFKDYYTGFAKVLEEKDTDGVVEYLTEFQIHIKENSEKAKRLIGTLRQFKYDISTDYREFEQDKSDLHTILTTKTKGLEEDERNLQELLSKQNKVGFQDTIVKIALGGTMASPFGIVLIPYLLTTKNKKKELESIIGQLQGTIDLEKSINRIVAIAYDSLEEMSLALDPAISTLETMATEWDDLDNKYEGIVKDLQNADQKVKDQKFTFLQKTLDGANNKWQQIAHTASVIKQGVKEFKVED